jgi:uncharacterized protein YjlB
MRTPSEPAPNPRSAVAVESLLVMDDGNFVNSPYPVRVYRAVFAAGAGEAAADDLARAFEALFEENEWPPAWRAGLYSVPHYHAAAHEVLGVFRGWARAQLGGERGPVVTLRAGDVLLLPAGVAHDNRGDSGDFRAVGAYPRGMFVDMRYAGNREADLGRIARVSPPTDPVFGGLFAEAAAGETG